MPLGLGLGSRSWGQGVGVKDHGWVRFRVSKYPPPAPSIMFDGQQASGQLSEVRELLAWKTASFSVSPSGAHARHISGSVASTTNNTQSMALRAAPNMIRPTDRVRTLAGSSHSRWPLPGCKGRSILTFGRGPHLLGGGAQQAGASSRVRVRVYVRTELRIRVRVGCLFRDAPARRRCATHYRRR